MIRDLPAKTEVPAFCSLSARQAALYQQAVDDLAHRLETVSAIERRGLVLAFLMRFKQIANHRRNGSATADGARPTAASSAGCARSRRPSRRGRRRCSSSRNSARSRARWSRCSDPSSAGRARCSGGTPVAQRRALVTRFQEDEATPFFVLSLKAGGTGLNLTAASHVVHFDRWWNPAVEDQATDRAFRIGQTKPVLVHKFLCRGTVEEKIDTLIASKRRLSDEVLAGGGSAELALTEMPDDELLRLVALDIHRAAAEDVR